VTAAFIARQPIFNPKLEVVGYELLFRGRGYAADAVIDNPEQATATVVLNTLTELELGRIIGNKAAWVNATREFVLGDLIQAIPPGLVGLEIPENELFDEEMVAALTELKRQGYQLALDDFRNREDSHAPLELFDSVKLNTLELDHAQIKEQVDRLRQHGALVIADKLGTRPEYDVYVGVGCDLFQGYFFCRPAVVGTHGITANRLALLQVVAALHDPGIQLEDIEQLIARDVTLSYRLLRYVNSAFFGLRGDVRSIGQALALLGIENVRRWTTLTVLASIDNKPTELTATALIRARFCELAGNALGIASQGELFTLGLFSVIDAMMDAPMHDVIATLPLADDMREALVHRRGQMGELLNCVGSLEQGEYSDARVLIDSAGELYLESMIWANNAVGSLFGDSAPAAAGEETESAQAVRTLPVLTADPSTSTAPPAIELAPAGAQLGLQPKQGLLHRIAARFRGLFGRRPAETNA
jgi:EAL and modified HD-GYP domain-containing signal transduction protein